MADQDSNIPWYKQYTGATPQGRLGDGREQELLNHVVNQQPTTPSGVAAAIDSFGFENKYLMTVGPRKGRLMSELIAQRRPRVMVELGGYIGYSAVVFGSAAREAGGQRYISIESNEVFADIARQMVRRAGLEKFVEVRVGRSDLLLRALKQEATGAAVDFLFIDHYKPAYLHDLKLCEEIGLVSPDTWIAADNVGHPGAPEYKAYVLSTVEEKKQRVAEGGREPNPNAKNWYLGDGQKAVEFVDVVGKPELEYKTECLETFEPDGTPDIITFTKCLVR